MRHAHALLALAFFVFFCIGSVGAATLEVPAQYPTIAAALAASSPGDTVAVSPGVYDECLSLHWSITIRAANPSDSPVIRYAGGAPYPVAVSVEAPEGSYTLVGLTFRRFHTAVYCDFGLPELTITECLFEDCSAAALLLGSGARVEVTSCRFVGNDSHAIWVSSGPSVLVENCLFVDNFGGCVLFPDPSYSGDVEIAHNTMVGNAFGISTETMDPIYAHSNIIVENYIGVWCRVDGAGLILECNDVWANEYDYLDHCSNQTGIAGNISAPPEFCDPVVGDYTISDMSPCVDSGVGGTNMGAFGIGCTHDTSVQTATECSWGTLKSLYR